MSKTVRMQRTWFHATLLVMCCAFLLSVALPGATWAQAYDCSGCEIDLTPPTADDLGDDCLELVGVTVVCDFEIVDEITWGDYDTPTIYVRSQTLTIDYKLDCEATISFHYVRRDPCETEMTDRMKIRAKQHKAYFNTNVLPLIEQAGKDHKRQQQKQERQHR